MNNVALHATGECIVDEDSNQTGVRASTDCNIALDDNQGCSTTVTAPYNYGEEFNANGGGVYAMEWTNNAVRVWFFPAMDVPANLLDGYMSIPDPDTFGTPSASFAGPCSGSFGEKFFNHSIIIDTTFCGGWGGGTFGAGASSCPIVEGTSPTDSCINYVAGNPQAFREAYWGIRSIRVWEKVPGYQPFTYDNQTEGILLPAPVTRSFPETPVPTPFDIPSPFVDVSPPFFEAPIAREDIDITIKSTISTTTTSTGFPGETLYSLAVDNMPIDDDFIVPASVTTAVPDTTVSALESLLAKITVPIPISVSPLTGGYLSLGKASNVSSTKPLVPETPDPEHGEGTFPDWNEDPYAESSENPTEIVSLIMPPMMLIPMDPRVGASKVRDTCANLPNRPLPCEPVMSESTVPVATSHKSVGTSSSPYSIGSWTTEGRPASFPPAQSLPLPNSPVQDTSVQDNLAPNSIAESLPPELLKNPPPTSIWGVIGDDLQDQLLALAAKMPAAVTPVVENETAPVPGLPPTLPESPLTLPELPLTRPGLSLTLPLEQTDTSQAVNGLLAFLDDKTKNQLLALLGPDDAAKASRQDVTPGRAQNDSEHVNDAFSSYPSSPAPIDKSGLLITPSIAGFVPPVAPPIEDSAQPVAPPVVDPAELVVPSTVDMVQSVTRPTTETVLPLSADLPLTAPLNTADTSQAMGGLLSLLDEVSKKQLLNLSAPPISSTTEPSREEVHPRAQNGYNNFWLSGTDAPPPEEFVDVSNESVENTTKPHAEDSWKTLARTLSDDTKAKLNNVILELADLKDSNATASSDTFMGGHHYKQFLTVVSQINTIGDEDKAKLVSWLTGGDRIALDTGYLMGLLKIGDPSFLQVNWQDVVDKAKAYSDTLDWDEQSGTAEVFSALKTVFTAVSLEDEVIDSNEPLKPLQEDRSTSSITPKLKRRGSIPQPDLITFAEKYQEYFPSPFALSEKQFQVLLATFADPMNTAEFKKWMVSRIVGRDHPNFTELAVQYFTWITEKFPNMTKAQQNELVKYCYYHRVKRYEEQPSMGQIEGVFDNCSPPDVGNNNVDEGEVTRIIKVIVNKDLNLETKNQLVQQMLEDYDNRVKSSINQSHRTFRNSFGTLTSNEQEQLLDRLEDGAESFKKLRTRQLQNTTEPTDDEKQGFLEQQIYAICPTLGGFEGFPTSELIAELEGGPNSTLEIALPRFRARLEAYIAKLQQCSSRVQGYAEALKTFLDEKGSDESNTKIKRQASNGPTGNTGFDALLQQKHTGDIEKWKFGILSNDQRATLHAFVQQALVCAMGNPNLENPGQDDQKCLENVTVAYDKVRPWISKGAISPEAQEQTVSKTSNDDIEKDLDIFAPDTVSKFVAAKQTNKNFHDLVDPYWVDKIRDLVFKVSSDSKTSVPILCVRSMRQSLRKNWKNLGKDVRKSILATIERPPSTQRLDDKGSLLQDLFGLGPVVVGVSAGQTLPLKTKTPPVYDQHGFDLVNSSESADPSEPPTNLAKGDSDPFDILHPHKVTKHHFWDDDSLEGLSYLDDDPTWSFDDLPDTSEVGPPSTGHLDTPKSHSHGYLGAQTPGGIVGNDVEDADLNTGFDDLADSSESKAKPGYEEDDKGESDPFGITGEPPVGSGDGVDDGESGGDRYSHDGVRPVPRSLKEPYSDSVTEAQDLFGDHSEDVYDIDDYMHNLSPEEIDIPSHADENAVAEGSREGYAKSVAAIGLTPENLNDVWGEDDKM
jgi:hypothetical protein